MKCKLRYGEKITIKQTRRCDRAKIMKIYIWISILIQLLNNKNGKKSILTFYRNNKKSISNSLNLKEHIHGKENNDIGNEKGYIDNSCIVFQSCYYFWKIMNKAKWY